MGFRSWWSLFNEPDSTEESLVSAKSIPYLPVKTLIFDVECGKASMVDELAVVCGSARWKGLLGLICPGSCSEQNYG